MLICGNQNMNPWLRSIDCLFYSTGLILGSYMGCGLINIDNIPSDAITSHPITWVAVRNDPWIPWWAARGRWMIAGTWYAFYKGMIIAHWWPVLSVIILIPKDLSGHKWRNAVAIVYLWYMSNQRPSTFGNRLMVGQCWIVAGLYLMFDGMPPDPCPTGNIHQQASIAPMLHRLV